MTIMDSIKKLSNNIYYFWKTVIQQFFADGVVAQASTLTFTSLLALVPLMAVSLSILSAFPVFQDLSQKMQHFIFSNFVAATGEVVQAHLQHFVKQVSRLSIAGTIFLFVTAVMMMFSMESAFNKIWRVGERRKGVYAFLLYWGVLSLSPILVGASIVVSSYVISVPFIHSHIELLGLTKFFLDMLPFLLSLTAFAFLYVVIPNCLVPISAGIGGAIVAAVFFEIAKWGFTYYVILFPTYALLYGALAAVPMFFVWVYLCWLITLLGCQVTYGLAMGFRHHSGIPLPAFVHAFRWIGYFAQAQQAGKIVNLFDLVRRDKCAYEIDPENQMARLIEAGLVTRMSRGRFILCRDLTHVTFEEFYTRIRWPLPYHALGTLHHASDLSLKLFLEKLEKPLEKEFKTPISSIVNYS